MPEHGKSEVVAVARAVVERDHCMASTTPSLKVWHVPGVDDVTVVAKEPHLAVKLLGEGTPGVAVERRSLGIPDSMIVDRDQSVPAPRGQEMEPLQDAHGEP
jgi:hypothetical protein